MPRDSSRRLGMSANNVAAVLQDRLVEERNPPTNNEWLPYGNGLGLDGANPSACLNNRSSLTMAAAMNTNVPIQGQGIVSSKHSPYPNSATTASITTEDRLRDLERASSLFFSMPNKSIREATRLSVMTFQNANGATNERNNIGGGSSFGRPFRKRSHY